MVIVEHDDGTTTLYAHNRENLVSTGSRVDGRSIVAYSGSTGRSTGPHLHFEAWYQGENITPEFIGDSPMKQRYSRIASIPKRYPIASLSGPTAQASVPSPLCPSNNENIVQ
jgi:murein DD-endopeptidase MepM/ murein hydrolase activator NlpD